MKRTGNVAGQNHEQRPPRSKGGRGEGTREERGGQGLGQRRGLDALPFGLARDEVDAACGKGHWV